MYRDKILITGSSGYIGSVLAAKIKKNIYGIDKKNPKFNSLKIKNKKNVY